MLRLILALACCAAALPAHASSVRALSPAALERGADRVVDATVIARRVAWNATRNGLETRATLAVEAAWKGGPVTRLELVVPGGELDGARHVVVGMPAIAVGEHARWFLCARGDGTYRVYGWAQGKWPARVVAGKRTYALAPLAAERDPTIAAFTTNGMVWPAAKIPVAYRIHNAGSDDLALPEVIAAFDQAFASWQAVPTASLAFQNAGMTDLGLAVDGENVMLFVESGWQFGAEAAAATSLFIIDGEQTADIAVNGEHFRWAIAPAGSLVTSDVLDLQAVLTHEIGHFSGLGHTERAYDTMYFTWTPWPGQRTLSIDDKLGLSSIYPVAGDECSTAGCPQDETCTAHPLGMLCEGTPDPVGAPCNYDRVECDGFCVFTAVDLSTGFCSRFCEDHPDCPPTHHCDVAAAGDMPVKVCFPGAPPPPGCATDAACPAGQHCDAASGACTFECRNSADCGPGAACDERGFCVATDQRDGGCQTGGTPALLGVLLAAIAACRSSRTTCRRRPSR